MRFTLAQGPGSLSLFGQLRYPESHLMFDSQFLIFNIPTYMSVCRGQPVPAVRWVQGDALDLPFPDDSFDAATIGYGLRSVCSVMRQWPHETWRQALAQSSR